MTNPLKWFDMRAIVSTAVGVALGTLVAIPLLSVVTEKGKQLLGGGGLAAVAP